MLLVEIMLHLHSADGFLQADEICGIVETLGCAGQRQTLTDSLTRPNQQYPSSSGPLLCVASWPDCS